MDDNNPMDPSVNPAPMGEPEAPAPEVEPTPEAQPVETPSTEEETPAM